MKHARPDPLERALELLRREPLEELPDPLLEARLRRGVPARGRRSSRRLVATIAAALVLGSAAVAASRGWLRRWWYGIEVDGRRESGVLEGEGERSWTFPTAQGGTATIHIERAREPDGAARTSIAIDREENGRLEVERGEEVFGRAAPPRLAASVLAGSRPFYLGTDRDGERYELHAVASEGAGSLLFVLRPGDDPLPVQELARLPFDVLGDGAQVRIEERADGSLGLSFIGAHREVFEFVWSAGASARMPDSELQTEDGRVRVRVENSPLDDPDAPPSREPSEPRRP